MSKFLENGETVLKKISLYYSGWECDETAYVVENEKGERYCVGTNHGGRYTMPVSELKEFIAEYKDAIKQTEVAINMLESNKD